MSSGRPWWLPQRTWLRAVAAGCKLAMDSREVPWQIDGYKRADALLRKVWDLHGVPILTERPGFGGVGRSFSCSQCRQPWPCETARLVINWGETTVRDYEPLRLIERPGDPA